MTPSFNIPTGHEKAPEPLPLNEVPSEEEATRFKEGASEAKKDYEQDLAMCVQCTNLEQTGHCNGCGGGQRELGRGFQGIVTS